MAQAPFNLSIQRVADPQGRLLPPQRAIRVLSPLTVVDVPAESLRGPSGSGEVTGYSALALDTSQLPGLITSRIVTGTSPLRVNGGDSADLGAGNITLTIDPATPISPGSMSAADKALINTLAVGSVAPAANTLLLRGGVGEGKCTSFEISSGGDFHANVGGDPVVVATVDGSKNIVFGDTLQVNSIQTLVKINGNVSTFLQGSGTWLAAALGASSKLSWASNGFENLHAESGNLSVGSAGLFTCESAIGNFAFTASGSTILSLTKAPVDPAPFDTCRIASDGDIAITALHALTLNGGTGGSLSRVVVTDAGYVSIEVNATEIGRFDATGLVIEKGFTFSITQPQSTSGAGRNLSATGQRGAAGSNGASIIFTVGDAGTDGADFEGDFIVDLGKSGDDGGFFRLKAGAFGEVMSIQYGATLGATALAHAFPYEETVNGYLSIRSLTSSVTIGAQTDLALGASDNVTITCGAGDLILLKNGVTEVARFDAGGPPAPGTIQPDAAASSGSSTELARADHVHGIVAATAGAILIGDAAAEGASTSFARADHTHSLAAPATPQSVGAASATGASTAPARADHVHADAWQKELGANSLSNTTTTRYLATGYNSGTAGTNALDMPVTKAFKIDSLRMTTRIAVAAGQTITGSVRKNGSAVGTATLATASDATSGSSSFTAVSYAAGDTWGLQVDKSANTGGSGPTDIFYSVGITPP